MATARKVTWLPEADGQLHLDHFTPLLLEATANCRQPFWSLSSHTCFPKCTSPQERGKTKENDLQREIPCPGELSALPHEHKRPDLETDVLILHLHSLHCFPFGMQHPPSHDLGHSWPKGQQHTPHTISINDKSLITYTVCKGIFFWKCTHCLVIYLLRSLIKGQQS